ncbi:unnamed protein product [Brassica oleracea]
MQFPAILEQKKNQLTQKKKMPRRRITRTLRRRWETMALRDTDLLLLQCSISLHRSHSARDFGLPSANDVFSQISGPPEFLNNRTEADEEATARDAEHAKRMTQ